MIIYCVAFNPKDFPFYNEPAKIIVRAALATERGAQTILNELEANKIYHSTANHDDTEICISNINKIIVENMELILANCGYTADAVQAIKNCLPPKKIIHPHSP